MILHEEARPQSDGPGTIIMDSACWGYNVHLIPCLLAPTVHHDPLVSLLYEHRLVQQHKREQSVDSDYRR